MKFPHLLVIDDRNPRSAPMNMACDEILISVACREGSAVLRLYEWARPALSFGYFSRVAELDAQTSGRERVRRWTGGGVVYHGEDVTYTLAAPRACEWAQRRGIDSYRVIHEAVAAALALAGIKAVLAPDDVRSSAVACFDGAAPYDVVDLLGRKLAGAAQRRTREGVLHQGSIQVPSANLAPLRANLVRELSEEAIPLHFTDAQLVAAEHLAAEKYATSAWLNRV